MASAGETWADTASPIFAPTRAKSEPSVLLVPDYSLYLASRLPRIFRHAGCAVDVLCAEGDPVATTRYARNVRKERTVNDVAQALLGLLRDGQHSWRAVVMTSEKMVRALLDTKNPAVLSAWQPGAQDPLVKKFLQGKFGLEAARTSWGLPIPVGRICRTLEDVARFGAEVSWPVLLKARDLTGGQGVVKINNSPDLITERSRIQFPCLAQKFIAGRMGVVDLLCSRGKPLAWLASYGLKHTWGPFSPTCAKLFHAMPALAPLVQEVSKRTRFEGFCGFDWIEEAGTGRFYLIEFHPRPTSGLRFGAACGVDFSAAVEAWLGDAPENFSTLTQSAGTTVVGHIFPNDLSRAVRERDWAGLRAWLPGTKICRDIPWDDPAPVCALVGGILAKHLRRPPDAALEQPFVPAQEFTP